MKNYLEHELYNRIYLTKKFPRDVINEMINEGKINHPKQAWKTLEKWDRKGLYDYGCCLDLGWLK